VGCGSAWKAALTAPSSKTLLTGKAIVFTLFSLPFVAGEIMGIIFLVQFSSIFVGLVLVISVLLHVAFHYLLKAPTVAGRRLLDQVDGFKLFLSAVDSDRLNRVMPPDKTPETFEKFLPYALALDLEHAWSENFAGELGFAGRLPSSGSSYTPSFYSGSGWNGAGAAAFSGDFSASFTSAISSSSSAPGSSSGSGGGSGGGGGGGGGGGW
jgi:uncharacterized membrane protein